MAAQHNVVTMDMAIAAKLKPVRALILAIMRGGIIIDGQHHFTRSTST